MGVISLSGGMDSATLLGYVISTSGGTKHLCVSFNYGSKHNKYELDCSRRLANHYGVPWMEVNLVEMMGCFKSDLLLSGGEIPEGHYCDETMKRTVVPSRNIIFLSILSGIAWSKEMHSIYIGVHQGDHAIYPDCRPGFIHEMREAIWLGTDQRITLHTPFLHFTKGEILAKGLKVGGIPYHFTRTCYKDQQIACGKCGACTERLEAFQQNGVEDPVPYE